MRPKAFDLLTEKLTPLGNIFASIELIEANKSAIPPVFDIKSVKGIEYPWLRDRRKI